MRVYQGQQPWETGTIPSLPDYDRWEPLLEPRNGLAQAKMNSEARKVHDQSTVQPSRTGTRIINTLTYLILPSASDSTDQNSPKLRGQEHPAAVTEVPLTFHVHNITERMRNGPAEAEEYTQHILSPGVVICVCTTFTKSYNSFSSMPMDPCILSLTLLRQLHAVLTISCFLLSQRRQSTTHPTIMPASKEKKREKDIEQEPSCNQGIMRFLGNAMKGQKGKESKYEAQRGQLISVEYSTNKSYSMCPLLQEGPLRGMVGSQKWWHKSIFSSFSAYESV